MNITKQRKRKQRPTDKTRALWLAVKDPFRRLKKLGFWKKRRKIPKEIPGQTVKFRRFHPYVIGERKNWWGEFLDKGLSAP